jgi:hypothetical protein
MKTGSWISAALLTGVFACSSGGSGGFAGTGDDLTDNGSSGSGTGNSSGSSGSGGSSNGSSGSPGTSSGSPSTSGGGSADAGGGGVTTIFGDAEVPDAQLDQPITLTMDAFTVPANGEVYKCQQFGNPFGHDVDLIKMVGSMSAGSHHFFLFNMSAATGRNTTAPLGDCPGAGLEFHPFPYLSQTPGTYTVEYGPGMGYPLVGTNGLMMNAHYLNTSSTPVTPQVTITIYPAKAGVVTTHVGTIFLNNISISVPANTPESNPVNISASNTPIIDEDYTIFTNWSHMHQYATDFTASTAAGQFYEETDWNEPALITAGSGAEGTHTSPLLPMAMKSGTQISWNCKYYNPTNAAMTFGDSALTQNMCIYLGQYYPADGTPSTNPNYPDIINAVNF